MPATLTPTVPPSLPLDHLPQRGDAGAPAILLRDRVISFAELDAMVGRLAAALQAVVPEPQARVATWLNKSLVACLMPLATARAGLIHVPVNPVLKGQQVAHILADSGAALLLTNAARAASLEPGQRPDACALWDEMAALTVAGDGAGAALGVSSLGTDANAIAAILYTSGSTGRPKGVVLSHANLWLGAESVATYLKLTPSDRVLAVLPLSFDYGQNQLLSAWYAGASVAPLDYLTARDVVKAVDRFDATTLAGVPPLWVQLVETAWPPEMAAKLKRLTNSGGALTRPLVTALRQTFPDADLYAMYGLTEAFRSTYLDPALIDDHPDSMGMAIPHAEVLICRPDGSITDDEEHGELVHCGPLVAQGYWQDAERTAQRFRPAPAVSRYGGSCVWSGDTVRRAPDGLLYYVGREDSMIKTAGNRVSPTEIEEAVVASGTTAEAVAFGVPDARLGAAIAVIARGDGSRDAELSRHLRATLPNFMQPSAVKWMADLPRNANGKLDRVVLAQQWAADASNGTAP